MSNHEFKVDYERKAIPGKIKTIGAIVFVLGLALAVAAFFIDKQRASFNSIIMLMFISSIGLGSLFLIALEYIVGAVWSVPFRRTSEILATLVFAIPLAALPALLNLHDLFHWMHPEAVAADKVLQGKAPYLNETFFLIRFIGIVLVMWLFYFFYISRSRKQDSTLDQGITKKNIALSAMFMPVFGVSITILAIDWLMSLEPHWFSTIFGVYYFAGSLLASLAALTFIVVTLNENGYLSKWVGKDHYYSLGALMFAFTNFWAYIAFSQFMLIWYANLPEETFWFIARGQGSWYYISIAIIFIRFIIPYGLLISQPSKKDPRRLKLASVWILLSHLYDLYWLVMPTHSKGGASFGWIEIAFPILSVGIIILFFAFASKNVNLIPIGDPKLKRAMEFKL